MVRTTIETETENITGGMRDHVFLAQESLSNQVECESYDPRVMKDRKNALETMRADIIFGVRIRMGDEHSGSVGKEERWAL